MFHVPWLVLQIKTSSHSKKKLYLWIIAQLSAPDKIICLLRWQWSAIARKYIVCTAMYRNILLIPHVVWACAQVMDPAHGLWKCFCDPPSQRWLSSEVLAVSELQTRYSAFTDMCMIWALSAGLAPPSSSVELNRVDLCMLLIMNSL